MATPPTKHEDLIKHITLETLSGETIEYGKDNDIGSFKYIEDMNLGFPIIELTVPEAAFINLNKRIQGSEIIKVKNVKWNKFQLKNEEFRIKAMGIATPIMNKMGNMNYIKFIAHHINQEKLMNFDKSVYSGDTKIISDLVKKTYEAANIRLNLNVESTEPLPKLGWWNLFIPYSYDAMKVIRKMSHYAMSTAGRGGYLYYHNKEAMHFKSMAKVMGDKKPDERIDIFEGANDYIMRNISFSPFNDLQTMSMGNVKSCIGYNFQDKKMLRYDWNSMELSYPMTDRMLQVKSTNADKCLKPYYTPCDDPKWMKAFAESMYVSQMFNVNLELNMEVTKTRVGRSNNWKVGDVIEIVFKNSTPAQEKYYNMSGWWLIKTSIFAFSDSSVTQSLKLVKAGMKPPHKGDYTPA